MGTLTPSDGLSPIGRLLQEVSYENAAGYHEGGTGRENVLTVEVFHALDFLPRTGFLDAVIRAARGAERLRSDLICDIERATVEVLVGDVTPTLDSGAPAGWSIQPDVVIDSPNAACLVEAKRLRPSRFQPQQVARCLQTVTDPTLRSETFVLLVLATPPPISVAGHGKLGFGDAVALGFELQGIRWTSQHLAEVVDDRIAWITWTAIDPAVQAGRGSLSTEGPAGASLTRLTTAVRASVQRHA